jgi:hypothetical protein
MGVVWVAASLVMGFIHSFVINPYLPLVNPFGFIAFSLGLSSGYFTDLLLYVVLFIIVLIIREGWLLIKLKLLKPSALPVK